MHNEYILKDTRCVFPPPYSKPEYSPATTFLHPSSPYTATKQLASAPDPKPDPETSPNPTRRPTETVDRTKHRENRTWRGNKNKKSEIWAIIFIKIKSKSWSPNHLYPQTKPERGPQHFKISAMARLKSNKAQEDGKFARARKLMSGQTFREVMKVSFETAVHFHLFVVKMRLFSRNRSRGGYESRFHVSIFVDYRLPELRAVCCSCVLSHYVCSQHGRSCA